MCVRLGTSSTPSRTNGFIVFLPVALCSWVLRTIELTFTGADLSSGTPIGASNVPIWPVVFSRTTILTENRPGGSVTPVW